MEVEAALLLLEVPLTAHLSVQLLKLTRIIGSAEHQISTDQHPSLPSERWSLTTVFVPVFALGPFSRKTVSFWEFVPGEMEQTKKEIQVSEVCWGVLGSSGTFWVTESIEQIEEKLKELVSPQIDEPKAAEQKADPGSSPFLMLKHIEEISALLGDVGHASVPEIIDVLRARFGGSVTRHQAEEALQNGAFEKEKDGRWRLL